MLYVFFFCPSSGSQGSQLVANRQLPRLQSRYFSRESQNLRKETLRQLRRDLAEALRAQGVAANAIERAVCGVTKTHPKDRIHRVMRRGASNSLRGTDAISSKGTAKWENQRLESSGPLTTCHWRRVRSCLGSISHHIPEVDEEQARSAPKSSGVANCCQQRYLGLRTSAGVCAGACIEMRPFATPLNTSTTRRPGEKVPSVRRT